MDRETHTAGIFKLIDPIEKDRMSRAFETAKSRRKWLHKRLAHSVEMHLTTQKKHRAAVGMKKAFSIFCAIWPHHWNATLSLRIMILMTVFSHSIVF